MFNIFILIMFLQFTLCYFVFILKMCFLLQDYITFELWKQPLISSQKNVNILIFIKFKLALYKYL
jgi:hypothetical protein